MLRFVLEFMTSQFIHMRLRLLERSAEVFSSGCLNWTSDTAEAARGPFCTTSSAEAREPPGQARVAENAGLPKSNAGRRRGHLQGTSCCLVTLRCRSENARKATIS